MSDDTQALVEVAVAARPSAHAPYSKFKVGAAVRLLDGRIFSGVNVENSSYPLGMCAERNAVAAAVRGGMRPGELVEVAIAADAPDVVSPCGGCRQVLNEFAAAGAKVHLHNVRDQKRLSTSVEALLPMAFVASSLPRS